MTGSTERAEHWSKNKNKKLFSVEMQKNKETEAKKKTS